MQYIILIIEDNKQNQGDIQKYITQAFKNQDISETEIEYLIAETGDDAIQLAKSSPGLDLIILNGTLKPSARGPIHGPEAFVQICDDKPSLADKTWGWSTTYTTPDAWQGEIDSIYEKIKIEKQLKQADAPKLTRCLTKPAKLKSKEIENLVKEVIANKSHKREEPEKAVETTPPKKRLKLEEEEQLEKQTEEVEESAGPRSP